MATHKRTRLSAERSQQLTQLLTITKTANMKAVMAPSEVARIIALVATDIGKAAELQMAFPAMWGAINPPTDYYSTAAEWFTATEESISTFDVVDMLDWGRGAIHRT